MKLLVIFLTLLTAQNSDLMAAKSFMEYLFGGLTLVEYEVAFSFAFMGMFLRWFWNYRTKGKTNSKTPKKFSWSYWFRDNLLSKLMSIVSSCIVIFISLRFSSDLFGIAFTWFYSFTVGLCLDFFISKLKAIQPLVAENKQLNN